MAEQTLRPYEPTWRDRLGAYLYDQTSRSPEARNFVGGLVGSTGLGTTGMSVADATPLGMGLQFQESAQHGDAKGMAMAALPMPAKAGAGMMRAPYQRKLSPQGLYSWGAEAAYNLPQETMTVQQARSMLEKAGTKPDEFHWSGFHNAFPDPNAKVSRDALVSHFENNVPQLGETVLGGSQRVASAQNAADRALLDALEDRPTDYAGAQDAARIATNDARRQGYKPPKFSNYAIPGGDNYREVLTTLKPAELKAQIGDAVPPASEYGNKEFAARWNGGPIVQGVREYPFKIGDETGTITHWPETFDRSGQPQGARHIVFSPNMQRAQFNSLEEAQAAIESAASANQMRRSDQYKSGHWKDDPNVLAHLRLSDRTDAGGNKVLHMEESQSDWGQDARKKGIKDPLREAELTVQMRDLSEKAGLDSTERTPEMIEAFNRLVETREARDKARHGVPNAPYIGSTGNKSATGWTDLNLKRALWEAAQNDADHLAWTPGADQAGRYDLSKQLDTLHYYPDTGELMGSQGGNTVISKRVPKDKLGDFVGKEVAERLLATEPMIVGNEAIHKLSGQDLSVGGEGMKAYYDRTIPTQLGAVMKRAGIEGGEMGMVGVPQGELPTEYKVFDRRGRFVHGFTDQAEAENYLTNVQTATGGGHMQVVQKPAATKELPALGLTPAMREQIKKGLPYFGLAPVGFGMIPQDDNQR